jgi:hypothetical protein
MAPSLPSGPHSASCPYCMCDHATVPRLCVHVWLFYYYYLFIYLFFGGRAISKFVRICGNSVFECAMTCISPMVVSFACRRLQQNELSGALPPQWSTLSGIANLCAPFNYRLCSLAVTISVALHFVMTGRPHHHKDVPISIDCGACRHVRDLSA